MKKNVKILGAAAAALLAVAPVVASATTVNADVSFTNYEGGTAPTDPNANVITLSGNNVSANMSDAPSSLLSLSAISKALAPSNGASVSAVTGAYVSEQSNGGTHVTKFTKGGTYYVQAKIVLSGLDHSKTYTLKSGNATATLKANEYGMSKGISVSYPVQVNDSNKTSKPYFTYATDATGQLNQTINGEFANGSIAAASNTGALLTNARAYVNANAQNDGAEINTSAEDIANQLRNQGVSVSSDGIISAKPGARYYVTLTAVNKGNHDITSTVRIWVREDNEWSYPGIYLVDSNKYTLVANGSWNTPSVFKFAANSKKAKAFAANPLNSFTAVNYLGTGNGVRPTNNNFATNRGNGIADLAVLRNSVDASTPGVYPVTVRATNPNGLTTTYAVRVVINPSLKEGHTATVQYKPGYGVNVWNVFSDSSRAFINKRAMDGQKVTIKGTATYNGETYYKVTYNDKNTGEKVDGFIPAEFLDGTYNDNENSNTNKPSNNNGEKAISGVARVTYNGKGAVKLLNADGRHVEQYVQKGSSWKVWAEKTVNGVHMYRIGNQSQWVPAMYVTLN